jgi:hypothetical protein
VLSCYGRDVEGQAPRLARAARSLGRLTPVPFVIGAFGFMAGGDPEWLLIGISGTLLLAVAAALVGRVAWGRTELGIRWSGVALWLLAIAAMAWLLWFGYQFAHGFVF